ncbi:NUDIX domain-containing protein [Spirosoma horti]
MLNQFWPSSDLPPGSAPFLPAVSIDNVIFGFHQNELTVLLLQAKSNQNWMLPGGFVGKDEDVDSAAARILHARTGLMNVFLQQFHVFGSAKRNKKEHLREVLGTLGIDLTAESWFMQRFISIGYYALVNYSQVIPQPDETSLACSWQPVSQLPPMLFDHESIIGSALQALRLQLNYQPIGYTLLPKEFPLKSLQTIYETILGRKLERSNFNRKLLSYGILERKEKHYTGGAHKAPFLYSFKEDMYFKALENGLEKDF